VEIRWCPAHEGIAANENADEWAKVAADQSHEHGVEWLTIDNRPRRMPPVSLEHPSRQVAEKKREEAKGWAYSRICNQPMLQYNVKYCQWRKNRPEPEPAEAKEGTAYHY